MADLQTPTARPSADIPSTSTSTAYADRYVYHDVFINHRGPDVKDTFATSLYKRLLSHRLQPFLDREELQKGEYIHPQIQCAIRTASVHIAIFSPRYAESPWCLDELLLILNKPGDTVIPVFYNVKPFELRWASKDGNGQYAQALNILEEKDRYSRQKLEDWRKALKQVSYIVAFELETCHGNEVKLLEEVVECAVKKRRKAALLVATYPTGLQVKVDDFEKTLLLQQQKNNKDRVMGIVGLGGAGKTTLAKELFNRKSCDFNKSFFLFDVRERARLSSLTALQRKLLKGLGFTEFDDQIDSIDEGIEIMRRYLSSAHVLLVLDDVDHEHQLDAFLPIKNVLHSDSLILVTSRYKDVLTRSGIAESCIYKLTGLNEQHSRQLFCSHAFLQPYPLLQFEYLVDEFCKACNGLPLSLRVFGALLCGVIPHRQWRLIEDILDLWQQSSVVTEVRGIRMVPRLDEYDAILETEKELSWFKSWCYEVLGNCLRKMIDNRPYCFRKLQLVAAKDGDLESILRRVESPNLVWLRWNDCPYSSLPSWVPMKNIRVLQVVGKKLKTLWRAESQAPLELRELNICSPLLTFPKSIEWLKYIEKIVLQNSDLKSLPEKFYHLPSLKYLLLSSTNLESLPDSFGCLTNLQQLDLSWCSSLQGLPDSFGRLTNLQHLRLVGCWRLQGLPDSFGCLANLEHSFGCLTNLQHLNRSWCSDLQGLPDSLGCLTNLQHLYLNECWSLQGLPDSLGCLTNLEHLDLTSCRSLQGLPDSFGCLTNLEQLYLEKCRSLQGLPDSFGCLTNLQDLDLSKCGSLQELPDSFGCLTILQYLDLSKCWSLQRLPDSFGSLKNLQRLLLVECGSLHGLPDSFGCLTNLQHLNLTHCGSLQGLPCSNTFFGNLIHLKHFEDCEGQIYER